MSFGLFCYAASGNDLNVYQANCCFLNKEEFSKTKVKIPTVPMPKSTVIHRISFYL
ncbi:hypothetical protein HMPREF1870_00779 [Bacteroidales bacterium KA00344]|nr:hypothetical protein HMPREF1870_00779 [Bacteroidales bacterium KA00344]